MLRDRNLIPLTIFTVLALPIDILADLFGMNVGDVPLALTARLLSRARARHDFCRPGRRAGAVPEGRK